MMGPYEENYLSAVSSGICWQLFAVDSVDIRGISSDLADDAKASSECFPSRTVSV